MVDKWTTAEVIYWLEENDHHRFVFIFQKKHVNGKDLTEGNLNFLDNCDHVTLMEKEKLLADVYDLVHPQSVKISEEDLTKCTSLATREKYLTAVEVAQAKSPVSNSASQSNLYFTRAATLSQSLKSMTPSSSCVSMDSLSSTRSKLNNKCDSPVVSKDRNKMAKWTTDSALLQRVQNDPNQSAQMETDQSRMSDYGSVYQSLEPDRTYCVKCVELRRQQTGDFGFRLYLSEDGLVKVENTASLHELNTNDILLELNGIILCTSSLSRINDAEKYLQKVLVTSDVLFIVALQKANSSQVNRYHATNGSPETIQKLKHRLELSERKWSNLYKLLSNMKNEVIDPIQLVSESPFNAVQEMKEKFKLQEEIDRLEDLLSKYMERVEGLQRTIDSKTFTLEKLRKEKKSLEEMLKQYVLESDHATKGDDGSSDKYKLVDIHACERADKEQVLNVLSETVKEATKQKTYLDKLLSAVIEHAPHLLDEVDRNFQNVSVASTADISSEEWC